MTREQEERMDKLASVFANGVMRAAADMLHRRKVGSASLDYGRMCELMRKHAVRGMNEMLDDGKNAPGLVSHHMAVYAASAASKAVNEYFAN